MTNKELIEKFKSSLLKVSQVMETKPHLIKRDEYIRAAIDNNLPRLNKRQLTDLGGFSAARSLYFSVPAPTKAELDKAASINLLNFYREYVVDYGITPSLNALKDRGFPSNLINRLFGSRLDLYHAAEKEFPEIFNQLVNDRLFTEEAFVELQAKLKTKKTFIITTAVSGKEVDEKFLNSMKTHEDYEDSMILIQPCDDVASRKSIFKYEMDRRLRDCSFVFKELYLNDKFYLSDIQVTAKQINPIIGKGRFAQSKGSTCMASPKQLLEFVANSNFKAPRALMTTGAVTIPDYSTDLAMSQCTSYMAEFDHKIGAVVVEIQNDKIFHFRQIQADKDGSFIDLGWKYNPDGTVEEVNGAICVFGDTHVGSHDLEVDKCLQEIAEYVNCKEVIVHDLFDCRFNNHHEQKPLIRAKLFMEGKSSMMREGTITAQWVEEWCDRVDQLTIVKSNHDEALERYLDEGRFLEDPENCYHALDLAKKRLEGEDVLRYLLEDKVGYSKPLNVKWLNRDEDYIINGIENGAHGDLGANGSRGSMNGIEKAYGKATVGHTHTGGIWRDVFRVGTSTYTKLNYNRGPSSWTNTMCIQYPNGSRQLVSIIKTKEGNYFWRSTPQ